MDELKEALKLFEENQGLVKHVYNKYFKTVNIQDGSDLIQEGFIGLYGAAKKYDETKGYAFSTYACKAIYYSMLQHRERYINKHSNISSLNVIYGKDDNLELIELIEGKEVDFTTIEVDEVLKIVMTMLKDKEKEVLKLRLDGFYQRAIGEKLGMSQVNVSRILIRIRDLVTKVENNEEIILNPKGRPKKYYHEVENIRAEVKMLRKKGLEYKEISEKLNIPKGSISSYLRVS